MTSCSVEQSVCWQACRAMTVVVELRVGLLSGLWVFSTCCTNVPTTAQCTAHLIQHAAELLSGSNIKHIRGDK